MWYYVHGDDWMALVQADNRAFAMGTVIGRGWTSMWDLDLAMPTPLPGLDDQIPEHYLNRKLGIEEAQELDRYMGGDGTFTVPAEEREVPWGSNS